MKKIFVTGGAGYIGSHVVKLLGEKGYDILIYDNLSTGNKKSVLFGELVVGDLANKDFLDKIISDFKPDAVIHFAASIDVGESVKKPLEYYANNTANTINLLEVMKKYSVKKFIFSSTAAVYGIPNVSLVKEDFPFNPISPYGYSKMFVEIMLKDIASAQDFQYVSLRYFNVAGEDKDGKIGKMNKNSPHLITRALKAAKGELDEIQIYGTDYPTKDGTCFRDYIYVGDLSNAHIVALDYIMNNNKSDVFNVGYGKGYSVREVLEVVKKVTGKKINIKEGKRREGDPPGLIADSSKIKSKLNWKPEHEDLEFIVKTSWNWIQNM